MLPRFLPAEVERVLHKLAVGFNRRFGVSNLPTTICIALGAILTVPVVLTIHGSTSFRSNKGVFVSLPAPVSPYLAYPSECIIRD